MSRHADIFDFHIGRRVDHWLWHILRLDDVCELDMLMLEQLQYSDGLHWLSTHGVQPAVCTYAQERQLPTSESPVLFAARA